MSHFNYTLKPKHIKHLLKSVFKASMFFFRFKVLQHSNKPSKQKTAHFFATASDILGVFENFLHLAL